MEPDLRDLTYLDFVGRRNKGQTHEEIAGALGFDSAQQLWERLADDGFPVCPDCGEKFPAKDHACKKSSKKDGRGRKVGGEIKELPDSVGAMPLFEAALNKLRRDMAWLEKRNEHLNGRRFISSHELSGELGESVRVYSRESVGPERWEAWCEERGLDPSADAHQLPYDYDAPLDIPKDYPAWPTPELVGTYVLADEDMGNLVDVLHPRPADANHRDIEKVRQTLIREAQRLAALVHGGDAGVGKRGLEILAAERRLAIHVRDRLRGIRGEREQAMEMIADELRDGGFEPLPENFEPTVEEVRRLADLD